MKKTIRKTSPFEDIKRELMERRNQLERELVQLSNEKLSDDQVQDPGDQAFTLTMEALRTSLQNTESEEYSRIEQALEAIDKGTYGICVDCGGEISQKRLQYYPNASRCLECQQAFEAEK
jgi:DnaK suppressor protein